MFYGLIFLSLYVLFNSIMCFLSFTSFKIFGAALYGAKALVDVLQLINAFELYKPVAGGSLML